MSAPLLKERELYGDASDLAMMNRIPITFEDSKELFLDVVYDNNGNPSFRTLNLSGNIYKSFVRDLELSSYAVLFDQCAFNETDDELESNNKINKLT